MSASLKTKDGSFSTAGAMLAHARAGSKAERIDLPDALVWAKDNGLKITPNPDAAVRINRRRNELRLPPFEIIPAKLQKGARAQSRQSAADTLSPQPIATTEDALLDLVSSHSGTVTGLVTPRLAGWLLELNTGNRPMMKRNLERFRNILREGGWMNTGEPIIISQEGVLNDGQHRLKAIVDTGISVAMDLRFGIAREAFHSTGTAKRRSASNVLGIEGYAHTSSQAGIARILRGYDAGQMGRYRNRQVESAEILAIVEGEELIGHVAAKIQKYRKFGPARNAALGFVLVVAARKTPVELVFEFADTVASGLAQNESDPARRLHVRLRDAAMRRERIDQIDFAVLAVKCWNAWLARDENFSMRALEADRTDAGFPQIQVGKRAPIVAA